MASDDEHEYQQVEGSDDLFVRDDNTLVKATEEGYEEKGVLEDGEVDYQNIHIGESDDGYKVKGLSGRAAEQAGRAAPGTESGGDAGEYDFDPDEAQRVEGTDDMFVYEGQVFQKEGDSYDRKASMEDGKAEVGMGVDVKEEGGSYTLMIDNEPAPSVGMSASGDAGGSEGPSRSAYETAQDARELEQDVRDHYDQQRQQIDEIRRELEGLRDADDEGEEGSGEFDSMEDLLKMHKVLDNSGLGEFKSIATAAYLVNQYKSDTDQSERNNVIDELEDRIDSLEQGIYGSDGDTASDEAVTGADEGAGDEEGQAYGDDGQFGDLVASNQAEESGSGGGLLNAVRGTLGGYRERLFGGDEGGESEGREITDDQSTFDDYQDEGGDTAGDVGFEVVGEGDGFGTYIVRDDEGHEYEVEADPTGVQRVSMASEEGALPDDEQSLELYRTLQEEGYTSLDLGDAAGPRDDESGDRSRDREADEEAAAERVEEETPDDVDVGDVSLDEHHDDGYFGTAEIGGTPREITVTEEGDVMVSGVKGDMADKYGSAILDEYDTDTLIDDYESSSGFASGLFGGIKDRLGFGSGEEEAGAEYDADAGEAESEGAASEGSAESADASADAGSDGGGAAAKGGGDA